MAADWIVTQISSREHYAVPRAFFRRGKLARLYTDAWCSVGRGVLGKGPSALRALAGRYHPDIPSNCVTAFTFQSLRDQLRLRKAASVEQAHLEFIRIGREFCQRVNHQLRRRLNNSAGYRFYGYNTGCLETMQLLREHKMFCVVNQIDPARVEEDLVMEETARWPGWEKAEGRKPEAYWQRMNSEWKLADAVVVNSQWSKDALVKQGVAAEKIVIIPLAYEEPAGLSEMKRSSDGPLRVLWLGSVILRKGIPYLLEAAKLLSQRQVQITVAGPISISQEAVQSAPANVKFIGRVTRDQATGIYQQADVFVLPTISDGFAITQIEAMSHGLPVIATPNCGQVVSDGIDGKIVPVRDAKALAEAIDSYASDRKTLAEASLAAREKAKQFSVAKLEEWLWQLEQGPFERH
jgi:glycosyltransferase involved in cell wall biosynthesis